MLIFVVCSIIPLLNLQFNEIALIGIKLLVYIIAVLLLSANFHIFAFVKEVRKK